ncbi:MAG: phosphoribosylaminoimidazolesuccinocarboxamide synthase [Acidobacteriota bacterium]
MALVETRLPFPLARRGKVRDVYDLGDAYLFVATDRISAFDHVLSPGIPGKGIILTQLSNFWFEYFEDDVASHIIGTDFDRFPDYITEFEELRGRTVVVRKCQVIPFECVARGYLAGSGWKEYQDDGRVCGIPLEAGLQLGSRLSRPIFTPATKEDTGHDVNVSFETVAEHLGGEVANTLRRLTLSIYSAAAELAAKRGVIIADTKFEFGLLDGKVLWIDEALTPDSSRFWPAESHHPGSSPPSFDKQFVRDWLESTGWDKRSSPPVLPAEIVSRTREKYLEAYAALTGERLE